MIDKVENVKKYTTVMENGLFDLDKTVNNLLNLGWVLYGPLAISIQKDEPPVFIQALVKF